MAHFEWSSHATVLLSNWPEKILVMPLVEEATRGYRMIENEVLAILLEECRSAIPVMREAIDRVQPAEGEHPAIFHTEPRDDEQLEFGLGTFPASSDLDRLDDALATADPLAALRPASQSQVPTTDAPTRHANAQAAAVVAAWIEHGGGPELNEAIASVVEEDGDPAPLVSGLINLCAYYAAMTSQLVGSTPQSLLGSVVDSEGGD